MIYTFIFYASLLVSTIGVVLSLLVFSWQFMLISFLLSLPYVLYLSATPRFSWLFIYPIILLVTSVLLFFYNKKNKQKKQARGEVNNDWW
ncbi:hypothetical protein ACFSKI_01630 [Pseudogracilibacillus auburnensis]|uniref:Uncharacterized protein n=1 Tax=Pseudogracilibacillus auburnensis TaxID=1494959 RepID=A0A2V3VEY9_9BACI|nr:hypothetical protein [Pseudogracilibacillus auburnensis]PXW80386.1 hypothetical protein DFR56_1282 [Pseudogracilibacillus auburnensis]